MIPETKRGTFRLGTLTVRMSAHYLPGVGSRVFLALDGKDLEYVGNIDPDALRLFANQAKLFACEADALERKRSFTTIKTTKERKPCLY